MDINKLFSGILVSECAYGENAHQAPAGLYSCNTLDPLGLDKFTLVEGGAMSYNNDCDLDRLLQTGTHLAEGLKQNGLPGQYIAVGVKHGNPCGAAIGEDKEEVVRKMMAGDPISIFGGLVMVNFEVDEEVAQAFKSFDILLDGIIAPSFTLEAIEKLKRRKGKCRLLANEELGDLAGKLDTRVRFRYVRGGFLVQPNYTFVLDFNHEELKVYGKELNESGKCDMVLAWAVGSTSNSNTITLVRNGQLIGNAVGQQDRVGAVELAKERVRRSKHGLSNAIAYSDSFFPFPDGPNALIGVGVKAILTSSGSVRDNETIEACTSTSTTLCMLPDKICRGFFAH